MTHPNGPFGRLARYVLRHQRLVVGITALLTVVAALLGLPPKVDSNLLHLLPSSDPMVQAVERMDEEEGGINFLTLTFRADDPDALPPYLDRLQAEIEAWDDIHFAIHAVPEELARQVALLQFSAEEVGELVGRLRGAVALGPALNPIVTQRLMDMGPLTERIAKSTGGIGMLDQDPGRGRLVVRPFNSAHDPGYAEALMVRVYALLDEVDPEAAGVELLWVGGAYRHASEDVAGIRADLLRTSVGSSVLVLLVLLLAFRSPRMLAVVFPPLILANLVSLSLASAYFGALNTYTSFGAAIIFGLGIDFAIHLVGRYQELVARGRAFEDAVAEAWDRTGPPCTTAALTSAGGFFALALAQFRGFAQLGALLAIGLLICLTAMLTLLPLLLQRFDTGKRSVFSVPDASVPSTSTYRYAPVGLLALVIATVAVGALTAPKLEFEHDISTLRRDGMAFEELSPAERAVARESYSPVMVLYDSQDEVAEEQERLQGMVRDGELPHVAGTVSIANVLPPDQEKRNARLSELVAILDSPSLRYLPRVLVERLLPLRGMEVRDLTRADLPEGMLVLLGAGRDDRGRLMVLPKGNMWDMREAGAMSDELHAALPGRVIAGEYLAIAGMFRLLLHDAPRVAGLALLLVFLLAWFDLKRPLWAFAAVATLLGGLGWATAAVWASGVKLSMINVTAVPILLGIGVDVVVHLFHRIRDEGPGGLRRALRTTGVAATVSTLTTIASFASLLLAGNRGVRSLGVLVVIGLATVFVVTVATLPLIWSASWRVVGKAPSQQG